MKKRGSEKISKEPYRGVCDLYPEDMAIQNYIFKKMRETAESFGYEEYNASILEPSELFEAKSGEELANQQTYKFKDKGERNVSMRPEMTPTVVRMIARKKRDLLFPIRFFSIANIFRYERPQKGRLREHWQLNIDIFGIKTTDAEAEIILFAHNVMKNFGAKEEDFEIKINSRKIIKLLLNQLNIQSDENRSSLLKLIDKKGKMKTSEFEEKMKEITKDFKKVLEWLNIKEFQTFVAFLPEELQKDGDILELSSLFKKLEYLSIKNVSFDPSLVRGLDYYTGFVFEIFDKNPENKRALFGGGRYDNLFELFNSEDIPAVGFGMGDVTIKDFLETHNLLPFYSPSAEIYICTISENYKIKAMELAKCLRKAGIKTISNITEKKIGDQIKIADKKSIPFVLFIGEEEVKKGKFKIKNLKTEKETEVTEDKILETIKKVKK